MSKPILPKELRRKIMDVFQEGHSTVEIFDSVFDEAQGYIKSEAQLSRCISAITRRRQKGIGESAEQKASTIPKVKYFEISKFSHIISKLTDTMKGKEFESHCHDVVVDILTENEGFEVITDANEAQDFTNPPFDFLGFKEAEPYMIEFKGSLKQFNSPGETQKRRLKELLNRIEGLNVALLQVNLASGEYRTFYNDQMDLFFDGKKMPIKPIEEWIKSRIREMKETSVT